MVLTNKMKPKEIYSLSPHMFVPLSKFYIICCLGRVSQRLEHQFYLNESSNEEY